MSYSLEGRPRCASIRTNRGSSTICHLTLTCKKPKDSKYPTELRTIGDHLRTRRLDLGLLQRDVADRLDIDVSNVRNWEQNQTNPEVRFVPAIVNFLGYQPFGPGQSFAERLRYLRRAAGLSQKKLAARAGFDETTIAKWERGDHRPTPESLRRIGRYFEANGQGFPDLAEEAYSYDRRSERARRAWVTRRRRINS
jgi:transcriptional regulator with XRE-family HTH domain